jgi:hypothetical protein
LRKYAGTLPREKTFGLSDGGDFNGGYQLPAEPTQALPGTEEKIRVLAERFDRHDALWHPQDAIRSRK